MSAPAKDQAFRLGGGSIVTAPAIGWRLFKDWRSLYTEQEKPEHDRREHGRKNRRQRGQVPVQPSAHEPRLVAEHAGPQCSPPELRPVRSDGQGIRLRQGVQDSRPQRRDQGPACVDDGLAGVVAGRLRPLRRFDDPPRVARRGNLSHRRRPRRRRRRAAALRAAQLLAGQRQPRQGAPAACGRSSRSTAGKSPGPT